MELTFSVSDASSSDITSIIELGKSYYDADSPLIQEEYLNWFYLRNPIGPAKVVKAELDLSVIGLMVMIPINMQVGGNIVTSYYVVNVLTHPLHRDKNIFVKLIRLAKEYLADSNSLLIGHPNKNAMPAWRRTKMSFKKPLKPGLYLPRIAGYKSRLFKKELSQDLEDFFIKKQDSHIVQDEITTIFDNSYFNWRYLDNPNASYKVRLLYDGSQVVGVTVTKRHFGFIDLLLYSEFINNKKDYGKALSVRSIFPTLVFSDEDIKPSFTTLKMSRFSDREIPYFITNFNIEKSELTSHVGLEATDF